MPEGVELETVVEVTGWVRAIPENGIGMTLVMLALPENGMMPLPIVTVGLPVIATVLTVVVIVNPVTAIGLFITETPDIASTPLPTVIVGLPVIWTGWLGNVIIVAIPEKGTMPFPIVTVGLPVTLTVLTVLLMVKPVTEIGPTIETAPVTFAGSVRLDARLPEMLRRDKRA